MPRRVCFEHAAPKNMTVHHQVFGARVEFNQEFNCIICAKSDLDTINEFADPAMARYAEKLLESIAPTNDAAVLDDVRRTILLLLPTGLCSIERVSEHMGVVPRTIQRRLTERGQSFSTLMNDIRKELAARYVFESNRSLTEVAVLLGFTAASSFSRWYLSHFGCSAKDSRAKAHGAGNAT